MSTKKVGVASSGASEVIDHLALAAARAGLSEAHLSNVRRWLVEQLVAHEYAKLSEGGHKQSEVPLRKVFVDLPVTSSPTGAASREDRPHFLMRLLSSDPLDLRRSLRSLSEHADIMSGVEDDDDENDHDAYAEVRLRGKSSSRWAANLLIGGPGQGKSTLGQLACQLHRVSLISPIRHTLIQAHQELLSSFDGGDHGDLDQDSSSGLSIPKKPFLPIHISLPDFAAWIALSNSDVRDQDLPVLVEFVASLPSASCSGVSGSVLLDLISAIPSFLVLDGFDEVGATQDRARIVDAARQLLMALASRGAHAQILATTRPQGYANELSRIGVRFQKLYLSPLTPKEALHYADKLINAKLSGADVRAKARYQIHEAAKEPATERLLTTPLQVTIMAALIQQLGRAPRERWNLFYRYFSTTYDREIERGTYASSLLAEHRNHIERIHARVALLLQVEAERQGGASARMPRERLEEVIDAVLAEDEVAKDHRKELISEIARVAENRLVFLVEPEPGRFGFEIRSLQEFMAAWALTSGRDGEIEARFQHVAKAPMFKNVALFIASRLFSEGSPLRDVLAERICVSLDFDPADIAASTVKSGALLALDTLEEGAALTQPKRARALMSRAISLLELPPGLEHLRLIRAADNETLPVLQAALGGALGGLARDGGFCTESAWVCVIDGVSRQEQWAVQLGERYWGEEVATDEFFKAIALADVGLSKWLCEKIEVVSDKVSPESLLVLNLTEQDEDAATTTWVGWMVAVLGGEFSWRTRTKVGVPSIGWALRRRSSMALPSCSRPKGEKWALWLSIAEFEFEPSVETLAAALRQIAAFDNFNYLRKIEWRVSWPLACCVRIADSLEDLRRLSDVVLSGQLGGAEDWQNAEKSWKQRSNPSPNLDGLMDGVPWSLESLASSPPFLALPHWRYLERGGGRGGKGESIGAIERADRIFGKYKRSVLRGRLADICLLYWRGLPSRKVASQFDPRLWVSEGAVGVSLLIPRPRLLCRKVGKGC